MTLKETADFLRVSGRTIQNLLLRGLPHFRVGALLRFRREEVMQFLSGNRNLSRHRQRRMNAEMMDHK